MDTFAIVLLLVGVVIYLWGRKDNPKLRSFSYFVLGAGVGLLVGALWAAQIVSSAFSGLVP